MEMTEAGQSSRTDIAVCYMSDRVDEELLNNIKSRIEKLEVDDLRMNQQSLAEALFQEKMVQSFPKVQIYRETGYGSSLSFGRKGCDSGG